MAVTADITFHYPPELFNLLVDTIPLLSRSKKDVLLFEDERKRFGYYTSFVPPALSNDSTTVHRLKPVATGVSPLRG